jgi:GNAT superfamily N-acetyltransferase
MGAHLVEVDGVWTFASDKYPTCPAGKVPLSVKDPAAQDLLWIYAQRRRVVDEEFSDDLETALRNAGFVPPAVPPLPRPSAPPGWPQPVATIPPEVIAAAKGAPFIHLRAKDLPFRQPILCDGAVVGFCHPHETPRGFRLGPIFVLPSHRGRGLTRWAYTTYAAGKRCVAYIHDNNLRSENAHAAAGFVRGRRGKGGFTWTRDP